MCPRVADRFPHPLIYAKLSELADAKGGKYYHIIAAREHGPNFEAVAEVYNDATK